MEFDELNQKFVIVVLLIAVLAIAIVASTYLHLRSLYQVPSYSFTYGKFWTYTGGTAENPAYPSPSKEFVELTSGESVPFSNFYWKKHIKVLGLWDVNWYAKTDLRATFGVSGSQLVETFGSWKKNFTAPELSDDVQTTIVETEWWIHRFKGYVYMTVEGSIQIKIAEWNPTWSPGKSDMDWICGEIEEWTRLKDSKVRFRIDAPDVLGGQSDFHGLMGMWVKTVTSQDIKHDSPLQAGYATAYISPCEASEEITLLNENGEPLLWGFPYGYNPESGEVSNLAFNPSKAIPQYAYFDVNIVDVGSIPHWTKGYESQWQYPDYDSPGVKLVFWVDVISTHHELFTIPNYEVVEAPPTAPGAYEPPVEPPPFSLWEIIVLMIIVIVIVVAIVIVWRRWK